MTQRGFHGIMDGEKPFPFFEDENTMENKITTKYHSFDLSGGAITNAARRFCLITLNYGLIRQHVEADIYDIETGKGEQRKGIERRVKQLRKAIVNHKLTPAPIEVCALPEHIESIDGDNITLKFNGVTMPLLNGLQRIEALESVRDEGGPGSARERLVDNLPFPVIVHLDPDRRKEDFLNLNNGFPVSKSHILQLKIDTGTVDIRSAPYLKRARDIAIKFHNNEESPFYNIIEFDQTTSASLNGGVLMTERRTDQIMSLFGSARLMELYSKDVNWFSDIFHKIYKIIKDNTKAFDEDYLLELPDQNGGKYKSGASFLIGIVNQIVYYLYLNKKEYIDKNSEKLLIKSALVFESFVDGDTSSKRRATLMREFAQTLFKDFLVENTKFSSHEKIPLTLITFFSPGCFGVETPSVPKQPTQTVKKGKKKKDVVKVAVAEFQVSDIIQGTAVVKADSDTSPDWTEEIEQ